MSAVNAVSPNNANYISMLNTRMTITNPFSEKSVVVGHAVKTTEKRENSDRVMFSINSGHNMIKVPNENSTVALSKKTDAADHIVDNSDYVVSYKNDGIIKEPNRLTIIMNSQERPTADMNFFLEAAKKYSEIRSDQDFSVRPTDDSSFVKGVINAVYGEDEQTTSSTEIMGQIDRIVRELAEQISQTGKADFSKLENEFEIDGEKIKATDLIKMVSAYDSLSENIMEKPQFMDPYSASSRRFAEQGMIKSFATAFYGDFSSKVAERIGKNISDSVEKVMNESQKLTEDFIKRLSPSDGRDYTTYNGTYATIKDTYERFANLDTSSRAALQNSFDKTNDWFKESDNSLFMTGKASTKYTSEAFNKLMNSSWDFEA